ncbi:VWA domain-containing protein [Pseudalkalibacillus sp. Hm43]|uniref:VWA domain-containing protein n=1 Tax=Pseudalkalibacillus sp. Hm43 TaxID=3450742 RepID=UPI003F444ACF
MFNFKQLYSKRVLLYAVICNLIFFTVFPSMGQAQQQNMTEGMTASVSASDSEAVEQVITQAESWLIENQNEEGNWGTAPAEKIRNTSEIAKYLQSYSIDEGALTKASAWLESQEYPNNDFMVRTLPFIKDSESRQNSIRKLLNSQNPDGGWGAAEGYESDVFDTVLVLNELINNIEGNDASIQKAITYLLNEQLEDGSWAFNQKGPGNAIVTSRTILLLNDYLVTSGSTSKEILASLKHAGDYLLSLQQEDQTMGMEGVAFQRTLTAYQAILQTDGLQPVNRVHEKVLSVQKENGSWEDDPYLTLLALQSLKSYLEATSVSISDIELYKISETDKIPATEFSAYETMLIKPNYDSASGNVQVLAFIETPGGDIEAVNVEEELRWEVRDHAPGEYKVIVQIKDKQTGKIAATSKKPITVLPTFKIENATIQLSPENTTVGKPEDVNVQVSLLQSSNIDGEVRQRVEVYDPAGELIASEEKNIICKVDKPIVNTNMLVFQPNVEEAAKYTIKTFIYEKDQLIVETTKEFEVQPPPPPTRVEAEQFLDKKFVTPGSDNITASYILKGLGSPDQPERTPIDMTFVMDVSGSMSGSVTQTKKAAKKMVELIQSEDRGAVIFFNYWASLIQNFTSDKELLKTAINRAYASGGTSIHSGISKARSLYNDESNPDREKVIVLLSDGESSRYYAIREAERAAEAGITIHTIGLGSGVDQYLMETIATATGGTYRYSPTPEELEQMMDEIGGEIFNLAGKNVTLSTTLPSSISIDSAESSPVPTRVLDNENGTTTVEWDYSLIVMNQIEQISLAMNGQSFVPGETVDVTKNTHLDYTDSSGEQKNIPLENLQVSVTDSLETTIQLDQTTYTANEDIQIGIEVQNNTEEERQLTATVDIVDEDGSFVEHAGMYAIDALEAKGTSTYEMTWNTGTTYTGNYGVKVTLKDEGIIVSETTTQFSIVPFGGLKVTTTTDKAEYPSGEDVIITNRLHNESINKNFDDFIVRTTIVNADQEILFEKEQQIPFINAQQTLDRSFSWDNGQAVPGVYTVKTEVWDGSEFQTSNEITFEILSSASTGRGLIGQIEIEKSNLIIGQQAEITYSLENDGNSKIENINAEVLIVDPITEEVIHTFDEKVSLDVSGKHSGAYSYETAGLPLGSYLVVLRTQLENGQLIPIGSNSFTVRSPIHVEKQIKEGSRILVWTENADENSWIQPLLKEKADYSKVVSNKDDFIKELRSSKYNVYLITDIQQPLTGLSDQELLAKVHNGHQLIVTNNANLADLKVSDVFGAKLNGSFNANGKAVTSNLYADMKGTYTGKGQRYDLTTAEVWAELNDGNSKPVVIANEYGKGTAVHIGLDVRQLEGIAPETLVGKIVEKVTPKRSTPAPGDGQLIEVSVKALTGPIDAKITEQIPAGVTVIDPIDFTLQNDTLIWRKTLEQDEEAVLRYMISTPSEAGTYSFITENGYWEQGDYHALQNEEIFIQVEDSAQTLLQTAIQNIESSKSKGVLKTLAEQLKQYESNPPTSVTELENAIAEIIKGLQKADQDQMRWSLENVMSLFQAQWYMGGRE